MHYIYNIYNLCKKENKKKIDSKCVCAVCFYNAHRRRRESQARTPFEPLPLNAMVWITLTPICVFQLSGEDGETRVTGEIDILREADVKIQPYLFGSVTVNDFTTNKSTPTGASCKSESPTKGEGEMESVREITQSLTP